VSPIPESGSSHSSKQREILLVASGDSRPAANKVCWPAQQALEEGLTRAFKSEGYSLLRAHPYLPEQGHGFLDSQRRGMDVFLSIPADAPLVVAEAVWQYSHHVLPGLRAHRGPILTVANWSGQWPGLVGLLNLNASLRKAGKAYSTTWSNDFTDPFFQRCLREWLTSGSIAHDQTHVSDLDPKILPREARELGERLARELQRRRAILGVFDEGCMGMYNAIIDDELLNALGIFKERLSQSALLAAMNVVPDSEARAVKAWLDQRCVRFITGPNPEIDLTNEQILEQCKMYIAAVRMAAHFGCDAIGIQYQQGLKDMAPASDLVEGLLNNVERPPVVNPDTRRELYPKQPLPHFNEVDECAGVDALITNRVWTALGFDPATTLHDVRWGEHYTGDGIDAFVWVFQISGAAPASHFIGGYAGAISERQPPMYFRLGGGTLKGVCKPGEIVWSRVFQDRGSLHADLGCASVVKLPESETQRRWKETTSQWPIMHAVLHGITRDQFMARHASNHLNVAYVPSPELAPMALAAKASMFAALGIKVHVCGQLPG